LQGKILSFAFLIRVYFLFLIGKNFGVRHVFRNLYGKSSDIFQQEQKRVNKLSQINTKKKKGMLFVQRMWGLSEAFI